MLRICKNIVTNKDNFKGFVSLTDENFNKFTQNLTGYFKATQVNGNTWTYEFTPGTFYNYNGELIEWNGGTGINYFSNSVTHYGGTQISGELVSCYLDISANRYCVAVRNGIYNQYPYICRVRVPESKRVTLDMIIPEVPNIIIEPL